MRRPNDITANPSKFWPFVYVDFTFGTLSGVLIALGLFGWASVVLWLGILPNLYFAFPALFYPEYAVKKRYLLPGSETVWLRNAGLLIFIITAYHVIAAIDPERFIVIAWATVAGRLSAGLYFLLVSKSTPLSADAHSND